MAGLALASGLYIHGVVARRRQRGAGQSRKRWRQVHYTLGLTAAALAVTHALLRLRQEGGSVWPGEAEPSYLAWYAFVLLAISGLVRARPPKKLRKWPRLWMWAHRALFCAALGLVIWHGLDKWLG